jgi:predicted DNA-binding ribbon-helix-helix protein
MLPNNPYAIRRRESLIRIIRNPPSAYIPFLDVNCSPNNRHDRRSGYCDIDSSGLPTRGEGNMKSTVVKRSIVLAGHKTSVSLEDAFWQGLKEIANIEHKTVSALVGDIDIERKQANLSSAIRLFVLNHYQA